MATDRIKKLHTSLPRGLPFDSSTLRRLGVSTSLAHEYVKSEWLERLGRGTFMFAGDELKREGTLTFLESRIPGLHVAAKTALAWHGFRENVALHETAILWGDRRTVLPDWFTQRFPARYSSSRLFEDSLSDGFCVSPLPESPDGPQVSGPERALLEMLSEVGVHQEVDEARGIMEGIRQLRTRQLKFLLANCRMVKAVRLCVIWAKELDLPWADQARDAASGRMGSGRWVARLKNGRTLILKSE